MAEEKEKGTNEETNRPRDGRKKELSQEELDKVSGGHVALSGSNENPTES
jgi:bacteriocin-like protein